MRVLVVEDSREVQAQIRAALGKRYTLVEALSLADALVSLQSQTFDLVLLDVMLPDGDGFQLCSRIRTHEATASLPVMFLTGKAGVADKVMAFSLGADDYVVKPFEPLELKARVEAKLRKSESERTEAPIAHHGRLRFEVALQRVKEVTQLGERDLDLTPAEFRILYFLARNAGKTFSREQLMDAIWHDRANVSHDNVYTHISSLRKKLGSCAGYLVSIPRTGYRFSPD